MPEGAFRPVRVKWLALIALGVLFSARPAMAHKLNVFAYAEGKTIHGEAYVRGGAPIRGAKLTAFDPSGEKLAETTTDDEGAFSFDLRFRCAHRLVVDAGEGHQAEYTVPLEELPNDLPPRGKLNGSPPKPASGEAPIAPAPAPTVPAPEDMSLREKLAAVERQIAALRKDLNRYQDELRLRDVLGGIGYILGLMGLAYYFLGVRRKEKGRGTRGEGLGARD